jgi:hypothetical protein
MKMEIFVPDAVYHVGSMDRSLASEVSYEGPCLSVSLCPAAWTDIARLGGRPCHELTKPGAAFLCVTSLASSDVDEIRGWAIGQGLIEAVPAWRAYHWDDERDEWCWCEMPTRDGAEAEVLGSCGADDMAEALEIQGDRDGMGLVEEVTAWRIVGPGLSRCPRMGNESSTDAAIMMWVEDVLRTSNPELVGLWWDENYDPASLSAPRGAIFPSMFSLFEATRVSAVPDDDELLDAAPETETIDFHPIRTIGAP